MTPVITCTIAGLLPIGFGILFIQENAFDNSVGHHFVPVETSQWYQEHTRLVLTEIDTEMYVC